MNNIQRERKQKKTLTRKRFNHMAVLRNSVENFRTFGMKAARIQVAECLCGFCATTKRKTKHTLNASIFNLTAQSRGKRKSNEQ